MKGLFLDAGHGLTPEGGIDNGAQGPTTNERTQVVALGRALTEAAKSLPLEVIPVGLDERLSVGQKTKKINAICTAKGWLRADCLLISLHMNSGPSAAQGVESWYSDKKPECRNLASTLVTSLANGSGLLLRPNAVNKSSQNRLGRLGILDDTIPLSCLLEVGFVTNRHDVQILESYRMSVVAGILEGLRTFLHLPMNSTIPADINPGDWFYDAVRFCQQQKIFDQTAQFRPHDPITRAELAVILARLLQDR